MWHAGDQRRESQRDTIRKEGTDEWTIGFRHNTLSKRRWTTSLDGALGQGGGQLSLCKSSGLHGMSFNMAVIYRSFALREFNSNIVNHNTSSTRVTCWSSRRLWHVQGKKQAVQVEGQRWSMVCVGAGVNIRLRVARLSSVQICSEAYRFILLVGFKGISLKRVCLNT